MDKNKFAEDQVARYTALFQQHGATTDAVYRKSSEQKNVHFSGLSNVFGAEKSFSLHDAGMGLGHYYGYLREHYPDRNIEYSGSDIVPPFVDYCRATFPGNNFYLHDIALNPLESQYDYIILGGLFMRLFDRTEEDLYDFMRHVLVNAFKSARKGIAFYVMSEFVEYRYDYLFYPKISSIIAHVTGNLSRFFDIRHSYPLYEYTVYVYKEAHIQSQFPDRFFSKYFKGHGC